MAGKRRITNAGSQKIIGKFMSRKNETYIQNAGVKRILDRDGIGNCVDPDGFIIKGYVWCESQLERNLCFRLEFDPFSISFLNQNSEAAFRASAQSMQKFRSIGFSRIQVDFLKKNVLFGNLKTTT